jgi:NTE family protein
MKEIGKTAAHALASGHHLSPALEALAKMIRFEPEVKVGADLRERLRELLDNQNSSGIPLHVSVYPSRGAILDSVGLVLESLAAIDTSASQLIHIQSLPESVRWEMVLASAAMPFIFDAREISGREWRGGPLGGWRAQPGQVPARELCERVTVSTLYVLHASDGSLWDRRGASLPPTIEIRPSWSLGSGNALKDSLHADEGTIENRLARGYEDARKQIGEIQSVLEPSRISRLARDLLKGDIGQLEQDK